MNGKCIERLVPTAHTSVPMEYYAKGSKLCGLPLRNVRLSESRKSPIETHGASLLVTVAQPLGLDIHHVVDNTIPHDSISGQLGGKLEHDRMSQNSGIRQSESAFHLRSTWGVHQWGTERTIQVGSDHQRILQRKTRSSRGACSASHSTSCQSSKGNAELRLQHFSLKNNKLESYGVVHHEQGIIGGPFGARDASRWDETLRARAGHIAIQFVLATTNQFNGFQERLTLQG